MKKLTYVLIVINAIAFTFLCFSLINVKDNNFVKENFVHVKKMKCEVINKNYQDKDLYAYVSKYGRVYKIDNYLVQHFNSIEEYDDEIKFKTELMKENDGINIEVNKDKLELITTLTTNVEKYISLNQFLNKLTNYKCEYIEFYE